MNPHNLHEIFMDGARHGPNDESRKAMCADAYYAFMYAEKVDKAPRDDTRAAACENAIFAYDYAHEVDKEPRDDTWLASGHNQLLYLNNVPGAIKLYFKDWLIKNRDDKKIMKRFCGWDGSFKKPHKIIRKLDIDAAIVYILSIRRTQNVLD